MGAKIYMRAARFASPGMFPPTPSPLAEPIPPEQPCAELSKHFDQRTLGIGANDGSGKEVPGSNAPLTLKASAP